MACRIQEGGKKISISHSLRREASVERRPADSKEMREGKGGANEKLASMEETQVELILT